MRAAFLVARGRNDAVRFGDRADPQRGRGEVLVRTRPPR